MFFLSDMHEKTPYSYDLRDIQVRLKCYQALICVWLMITIFLFKKMGDNGRWEIWKHGIGFKFIVGFLSSGVLIDEYIFCLETLKFCVRIGKGM